MHGPRYDPQKFQLQRDDLRRHFLRGQHQHVEASLRVAQQESTSIIVKFTVTTKNGFEISMLGKFGGGLPEHPCRTHGHGASHPSLVIVIEDRLISYDKDAATGGWDTY